MDKLGKPISRKEAIRLCREILERAEQERLPKKAAVHSRNFTIEVEYHEEDGMYTAKSEDFPVMSFGSSLCELVDNVRAEIRAVVSHLIDSDHPGDKHVMDLRKRFSGEKYLEIEDLEKRVGLLEDFLIQILDEGYLSPHDVYQHKLRYDIAKALDYLIEDDEAPDPEDSRINGDEE